MTGQNVVPFAPTAEAPLPPNNVEVEQGLLGALLLDNRQLPVVSGLVRAEDFFWRDHQEIFTCISDLIAAGRPATSVTVKGYLNRAEIAEQPAAKYLSHIAAEATTTMNAAGYAAIVKDMATRRALKAFGEEIAHRAQFDPVEASGTALLEHAESTIHGLRMELSKADAPHLGIRALNRHLLESINTVRSGTGAPVPTSGFRDIDKQLGGGLRPGRLMVFAGRPGMGKTILGLAFARRCAESGIGAALYSLEIDGDELGSRVYADMLGRSEYPLAYRDILAANDLTDGDVERIEAAMRHVERLPLVLEEAAGATIAQIEARARVAAERFRKAGTSLGVVVIDYLGLVTASDRYKGQKVDEVGEIAKAAKEMSKRLGVCVILLAQLNRGVEGREDKRPLMSDLRDSGNIEEHADVVGLLYRPYVYTINSAAYRDGHAPTIDRAAIEESKLFVGFGKNRLGPTGNVELWCNVGRSCLRNADRW